MPRFHAIGPREIVLGGDSGPRRDYGELLRLGRSGSITLAKGEDPEAVQRQLQRAAREQRTRIRWSWADRSRRVLRWQRAGK